MSQSGGSSTGALCDESSASFHFPADPVSPQDRKEEALTCTQWTPSFPFNPPTIFSSFPSSIHLILNSRVFKFHCGTLKLLGFCLCLGNFAVLKTDVMEALEKEVKSLDEDSWKFAGPRSQIHLISRPGKPFIQFNNLLLLWLLLLWIMRKELEILCQFLQLHFPGEASFLWIVCRSSVWSLEFDADTSLKSASNDFLRHDLTIFSDFP